MAEHLVYHWKHGWIPLTHAAALSKAHGSSKLADKYVKGTSSHHSDRLTAGKSARQLHANLEHHARITARPGTYRGESGHNISGTDTKGRRVGVFVPGDRAAAQRVIDNLHAGREPFHTEHPNLAPVAPGGAPRTPGEAFKMGGPELKKHAGNGSSVAQAEIDRRAAKRSTHQTQPSHPAPQPHAERHADSRGGLKVGDEVVVKVGGQNRVGTVHAFDNAGRAHVHVQGHGTVIRSASDVSKDIPASTRAAEERHRFGDLRKTPTATLQAALERGGVNPDQHEAYRRELERRGVKSHAHPASAAPPKPTAAEDHAAENARIAPHGHTIITKELSGVAGGAPRVIHTQHDAAGTRVGSVVPRPNGEFGAMYQGAPLGEFHTRKEAHAALAAEHARVTAAREAAAAAKADAARKKADAAARRQAKAVPVGVFQPHKMESDGTIRGDAAAGKIKQSFKFKNHTVHIESAMTKEQTAAFLSDVHSVLLKSNNIDAPGITFHVPTGDGTFRAKKRGTTGGYVRQGQRTIFVNPKVADGSIANSFGGPDAAATGQFMPAVANTNGRQYVITHELGHILDGQHHHTTRQMFSTPSGMQIPGDRPAGSTSLHREQRGQLSKYGQSNPAEGYAEAYAQWIHGGPGSSAAADAYAAKFGWVNPKWYREGRAKP